MANRDTVKKDTLEQVVDDNTNKKNALAFHSVTEGANSAITYYIIAGSFKTEQGSEKLIKKLQEEGTKCEIVVCGQYLYRVSIGSFHSKDEALNELNRIKAIKGPESVWLMSK